MNNYKLVSTKTGKVIDESESCTTDPQTGAPLEVVYDYEEIKKSLNSYMIRHTPSSTRKYLDLFPIRDYSNVVSMQEGNTPLYRSSKLAEELDIKDLYLKYEGANPTGAFKDRGSLVEITKAIELGAEKVVLASTGNMAASVSAYSSKVGIECYIFIPEDTAPGKLVQSLSFGSKVIQIHGDYNTAADLAEKTSEEFGFFLAGDYAFRHEGQKSQAYEIVEQLNFEVPDYVLVPVGNGINISAIWKGFKEYKELGFIDSLPKMVAVQAEGVSPIIKRFKLDLSEFEVVESPKTVASAIAVGNPLYGELVMKLLAESDGMAVSVTDEETLEAQHDLAKKEAVFTEPAGATVIAAMRKLKETGEMNQSASYVCLLSGNGLKDPVSPMKILAEPPTIDPEMTEVNKILSSEVLNVRSFGAKRRDEVLFEQVPTQKELVEVLADNFDYNADEEYVEEILKQIKKFVSKGKRVAKADLQYIIENTIQTFIAEENQTMKVLDFEITTRYEKSPQATMKVWVEGNDHEVTASGVGPVDAAVNALQKACSQNGCLDVELVDYNVMINNKGTNAAVDVNMKLETVDKENVVGRGTSPDIIQASIDAFVTGYNVLVQKAREK